VSLDKITCAKLAHVRMQLPGSRTRLRSNKKALKLMRAFLKYRRPDSNRHEGWARWILSLFSGVLELFPKSQYYSALLCCYWVTDDLNKILTLMNKQHNYPQITHSIFDKKHKCICNKELQIYMNCSNLWNFLNSQVL